LVPSHSFNVCHGSNSYSMVKRSFSQPRGGDTPSNSKSKLATGGLESFRGRLEAEGISEQASSLIMAARRGSTSSHYESAWRKWGSWCAKRQVDPFSCPLNNILEFLSDAFNKGLLYNTLAGYRSAISAYHDPIDGVPIGSHPRVSALLTGVHNLRCPKPKYNFIWDIEKVVKYLDTLDISTLSDKMLSWKLTMLLAITSSANMSCFIFSNFHK